MALMDRIEAVCADPAAREDLNRLIQDLGVRIGLTFREGRRNNRPVRVLQGGIVAFGNRPLPCTLRNSSGRPLAGGLPEPADDEQQGDSDHKTKEWDRTWRIHGKQAGADHGWRIFDASF